MKLQLPANSTTKRLYTENGWSMLGKVQGCDGDDTRALQAKGHVALQERYAVVIRMAQKYPLVWFLEHLSFPDSYLDPHKSALTHLEVNYFRYILLDELYKF